MNYVEVEQAIGLPGLRLVLSACCVATIVPRLDIQIGATLLGSAILGFVYLRGRPAQVDVSA